MFGNQGGLFMNAMTWWDHKTGSVWSQPWGRAIAGTLKGVELKLYSSELVPWKTWREVHPDTLALISEEGAPFGGLYFPETFQSNYVIGVTLGDAATAVPYPKAAAAGIINTIVGGTPIVIHGDSQKLSVHVYLREADGGGLTFFAEQGVIRDQDTGSTWSMERGVAVDGSMRGQTLRSVPYIPAFGPAWQDFFPQSDWYLEDR